MHHHTLQYPQKAFATGTSSSLLVNKSWQPNFWLKSEIIDFSLSSFLRTSNIVCNFLTWGVPNWMLFLCKSYELQEKPCRDPRLGGWYCVNNIVCTFSQFLCCQFQSPELVIISSQAWSMIRKFSHLEGSAPESSPGWVLSCPPLAVESLSLEGSLLLTGFLSSTWPDAVNPRSALTFQSLVLCPGVTSSIAAKTSFAHHKANRERGGVWWGIVIKSSCLRDHLTDIRCLAQDNRYTIVWGAPELLREDKYFLTARRDLVRLLLMNITITSMIFYFLLHVLLWPRICTWQCTPCEMTLLDFNDLDVSWFTIARLCLWNLACGGTNIEAGPRNDVRIQYLKEEALLQHPQLHCLPHVRGQHARPCRCKALLALTEVLVIGLQVLILCHIHFISGESRRELSRLNLDGHQMVSELVQEGQ